jgi:hypothetical protein
MRFEAKPLKSVLKLGGEALFSGRTLRVGGILNALKCTLSLLYEKLLVTFDLPDNDSTDNDCTYLLANHLRTGGGHLLERQTAG